MQVVAFSRDGIISMEQTTSSMGGMQSIMGFATATINFLGALNISMPAWVPELKRSFSALRETSNILSIFGFVGLLKSWICDKSKRPRWQNTAALVGQTGLKVIGAAQTLDAMNLLSLGRIAATQVGRVPFLSLVTAPLGLGVSCLNLWDNALDLHHSRNSHKKHRGEQLEWITKRDEFERTKAVSSISDLAKQLLGDGVGTCLSALAITEKEKENYVAARLHYEVTRIKVMCDKDSSDKQKAKASLINTIIGIAMSILGFIGLCGVVFLAPTGLPMLTLVLIVAARAIYQTLNSNRPKVAPPPNELEKATNDLIAAAKYDRLLLPEGIDL